MKELGPLVQAHQAEADRLGRIAESVRDALFVLGVVPATGTEWSEHLNIASWCAFACARCPLGVP